MKHFLFLLLDKAFKEITNRVHLNFSKYLGIFSKFRKEVGERFSRFDNSLKERQSIHNFNVVPDHFGLRLKKAWDWLRKFLFSCLSD